MIRDIARWYDSWQDERHAEHFDGRGALDVGTLVRNYESFNDVRLLNERVDRSRRLTLLEVGCATGEFYRYLRRRFPLASYIGVDGSEPAIARAREKYPEARFYVTRSDATLPEALRQLDVSQTVEVVYTKDVLHHQTRPFEFLSDLLSIATESTIIRCRTRDVGATELDPEKSCQHHYMGWLPYTVINLSELIAHVVDAAPEAEVIALRHHMILGGQHGRFLPKECYLRETGTAEMALGIFKRTQNPGLVTVEDRAAGTPRYTLGDRLRGRLRWLVGTRAPGWKTGSPVRSGYPTD